MSRRPAIFVFTLAIAGITSWVLGQAYTITVQRASATTHAASPSHPPPSTAPLDPAMADLAEFMARAEKLKDNDAEDRLSLARWARDRQMWSQALEMAKQALYIDPYNRAAYTILQQVDEARPLPDEPELAASLKTEFSAKFGHEFKTRNSKHFLLCYDTTDTFAAQRGASMEKVYDAFQFYFNMSKLRPAFLDKRLVVICFKERDDYLTYIRSVERGDMTWSAGLYSQRTNRAAFYDDTSGPGMATFDKQSDELKAKIDDLNKRIAQASLQGQTGLVNQLTVERNRYSQSLNRMTTTTGNIVNMMNTVKSLHEAAHQIAFNTGIQKRLVDYPLWFTEGLACSFETEDSAGRRGPAVLNFGRIAVIKDGLKADTITPVEKFIAQGLPDKLDETTLGIYYAEGWALFHYLYKFDRAGTEKFLLAYQTRLPGRAISPDERRKIFTDSFGDDFETLDKKFQAYLKALPLKPN